MVGVAAEHGVGAAGTPVAVTALQPLPTQPVLALTAPADTPGSLPTDPASTGDLRPAVKAVLRLSRLAGSQLVPRPRSGSAHYGGGHQDQQ